MLGKPDPKKIEEMMKKLNMNIQQLPAEEVTIKTKDRNLVISNPQIMIARMGGRDIYQITGDVKESGKANEEDIQMVMEKTGKDRETVEKKLEELDNDLARAIIELKKAEGKHK
ncbi:nascent polypeptide-associated complex protein [Candidatus Woesearchaeota archaeon]|nr:nascent polypeptide-associated complex protein [Candidatus Woesearchaeota archaeon]